MTPPIAVEDDTAERIGQDQGPAQRRGVEGEAMNRTWGVWLGTLLIMGLAACSDAYEAGLAKARVNDASPEGQAYAGPLGQTLGPSMQQVMKGCLANFEQAPQPDFSIILMVRADGTAANLMAKPESPTTRCIVEGLESLALPTPPRPDWWVVIEMKTES
jgi:hypothetical protein